MRGQRDQGEREEGMNQGRKKIKRNDGREGDWMRETWGKGESRRRGRKGCAPTRESYKDLNDYSVVILMEYKDVSFIFSGDATKLVERDILETGKNINADILKVAHHGSSSSSADEFIKAVNPSIGIISLGAENDYGHPHKEVENVLNKYNIETFRTDISENIIVSTDGVNYNVQNIVH